MRRFIVYSSIKCHKLPTTLNDLTTTKSESPDTRWTNNLVKEQLVAEALNSSKVMQSCIESSTKNGSRLNSQRRIIQEPIPNLLSVTPRDDMRAVPNEQAIVHGLFPLMSLLLCMLTMASINGKNLSTEEVRSDLLEFHDPFNVE